MNARLSSDGFEEIYSALHLPVLQNRMFQSADAARKCVRGDVRLVRDPRTGLIFNRAFQPALMQYDADYQNEQAVSAVFRTHLDKVCDIVQRHFGGCSLIEVGCGKGHFLEQLQSRGFRIVGLDPAYEGANPSVIKQYFSPELGLQADGIVLRHVLEHVQDPTGFLGRVRDANGGKGKIYIEVPCFDWICKHRAWFDIFYEHVNYFRVPDFYRMFGVVHECAHVFAGQYLYVVADLASVQTPIIREADNFVFPADFLSTVDRHVEQLKADPTTRAAIWGALQKGLHSPLLWSAQARKSTL